ncbi:MAG TPA: hypothetical protein VF608_13665 [Thermoanaerobaculia bacterium]
MTRLIRRLALSLAVLALTTPMFAYDVVNTSSSVTCLFSTTCSVSSTDHIASFAVSGASGSGQLQSRITQGQPGSVTAGKWIYQYRINLTAVAGITYIPYVDQLAIGDWGAVLTYDYDANGIVTDDVYNITSGALGTKPVTSAFLSTPWTYFILNNPVYAGSYPGGGESSYFFGLLSDRAPVLRSMWIHTDSGWISVTGYAPPVP